MLGRRMSAGFCSEAKSSIFPGNRRRAALGEFEGLAEQKWRKRREWRDRASFLGLWSSAGNLLLDVEEETREGEIQQTMSPVFNPHSTSEFILRGQNQGN